MTLPDSVETLLITAFFIVPGYLGIIGMRSVIVSQRKEVSKTVIESLAVSMTFWVLMSPLLDSNWANSFYKENAFWALFCLAAFALTMPPTLGFLLAKLAIKKSESLSNFGIRISPPKAWDFQFSRNKSYLVRVTLDDNSEIAGIWAGDSCASVYPEEEDLYLEKVVELDEDGQPTDPIEDSLGAWIPRKSIRVLQFSKVGDKDER